ncbi:Uncharacterised protein [Mycobacterium tuberculosis]|nr:Uncharacterised protein [Mycobacterium tuberculosis]
MPTGAPVAPVMATTKRMVLLPSPKLLLFSGVLGLAHGFARLSPTAD